MKNFFLNKKIAVVVALTALSACTTQPLQPLPQQTPQQVVSQACVLLPGIIDILGVESAAFPAKAASDIQDAQKILSGATINGEAVPGICSPGFVATAQSVQTLANTIMPIIVNAVELSPTITPQVKAEVAAAQGIFLLVQAQQAAQTGVTAPANPAGK